MGAHEGRKMNIGIIQQLSHPTDCTVCGEPAYSAALCKLHYRKACRADWFVCFALCKLHYRKAYKPIGAANFSPTERRDIARQYWRQKKRIKLARTLRLDLEGKAYFEPACNRLIISMASENWKRSEVMWLERMEKKGEA